ncbi:Pleckstrin y domain-containing F member 2 [Clonorchis sinensis]|uniref:Pleckstrin y domain-containing F member 2 n=2 Tax=Clonorchis sinensis TaxID=79923 RepID=A0A419PE22_CLOSI|nr:Pleckstrin y domain-containing F member 2 [Clonorchis sinensis]
MDSEQPLYVLIGEGETNSQRIAAVEKLFGFSSQKLMAPKRVLVGEGVLTKICRRKPKLRHFFLFNDVLLYGRLLVHRKLGHPQFIDLSEAVVEDICDNGIYRNGFAIMSPKKSFTVYSSTAEEKTQWVAHMKRSIAEARTLSGNPARDEVKLSPIWIPDAEASHCMVCRNTEFTLVHRRHHCRNCGKVVCHKCSSYRWMLPYQGSSRVRICSECHSELQTQSQQLMNRTIENEPPGPAAEPETGSEAAASVTEPSESPEASKRSTRFFTQNEPTAEDPVQEPTYLYDAQSTDDLNTDSDSEFDSVE